MRQLIDDWFPLTNKVVKTSNLILSKIFSAPFFLSRFYKKNFNFVFRAIFLTETLCEYLKLPNYASNYKV